jgi:hypothetical protein
VLLVMPQHLALDVEAIRLEDLERTGAIDYYRATDEL